MGRGRRRVAIVGVYVTLGLALAALSGWVVEAPLLSAGLPEAVPMAPSTALVFAFMALGLWTIVRESTYSRRAVFVSVGCAAPILLTATSRMLGLPLEPVERLFFAPRAPIQGAELGLMSWLTLAAFLAQLAGVFLLVSRTARLRRYAALPALAAGAAGAAVVVGYAYHRPLLYGGGSIPMACTTGLAFVASSMSLVAVSNPDAWPVRAFRGETVHARLLRAFVPLGVAVVLLHGWVTAWAARASDWVVVSVAVVAVSVTLTCVAIARVAKAISASIDAAEERHLRAERERVTLAEAERLREEWAAMIVHDLKNPLSVVASNLAHLHDALDEGAGAREVVRETEEARRRLDRLLKNLLDVYQLEAGEVVMAPVVTCVVDVVRAVAERTRHLAEERSIAFVHPSHNGVEVMADPDALTRVLENIVDNCLRYTPTGGRIEVAVAAVGRTAQVRIGNTGEPIPSPSRSAVFDRYTTAPASGRHARQGIGLYFCRLAIEGHGGRIWVEETMDLPTVFCFEVPLVT